MLRKYTFHFRSTNPDATIDSDHQQEIESDKPLKELVEQFYAEWKDLSKYYDGHNFTVDLIQIRKHPLLVDLDAQGNPSFIDFELMDRMDVVRKMCSMGAKVRGEAKIRNRQPLGIAYCFFSDSLIHNCMIYQDHNYDNEDILKSELNVLELKFIPESEIEKFFDYNLKPNFRILGSKGMGKQAQQLKGVIAKFSQEQHAALYSKLKTDKTATVAGIDISLGDVEIEFQSKTGYASAAAPDVGAIVLDLKMTPRLERLGFIREFVAAIQNIRKQLNLDMNQKIGLCVYGQNMDLLLSASQQISSNLNLKDLVISGEKMTDAREIKINDMTFYIVVI